jgi:hypothetical protein
MKASLPVLNLAEAKFECIYGRGCDGICCQNGRPSLYPDEIARLDAHLSKVLPELRPEARAVVERQGYLSRRTKFGLPMARVVNGWCVFFHQGCVLHKVGAQEGDKYRYKPAQCALFPLARTHQGDWYVRQHGVEDEQWNLFCLDPAATTVPATESLQDEFALAYHYTREEHAARAAPAPSRQAG